MPKSGVKEQTAALKGFIYGEDLEPPSTFAPTA